MTPPTQAQADIVTPCRYRPPRASSGGPSNVTGRPLHHHCRVVLADIRDLRVPAVLAAFPTDDEASVWSQCVCRSSYPAVAPSRWRRRRHGVVDALSFGSPHLSRMSTARTSGRRNWTAADQRLAVPPSG